MRQIKKFLTYRFIITDKNFKLFFFGLFGTTLLSYIANVFVFLPETLMGFNWSGIAWMTAFVVSVRVLSKAGQSVFPLYIWLPWLGYMFFYILYDFSTAGLQLSVQYILPILMGYTAATFTYNLTKLLWVFQGLIKTTLILYLILIFYQSTIGFAPNMAGNPMFLIILGSICLGLYFFTKKNKFIIIFGLLFLIPFLSVTRMGLLVFGLTFILHFANRKIQSKIGGALLGAILMLGVANSKGFQEKTFYSGSGELSDLNVNYYENDKFNSSGRSSWKKALEPGLAEAPIFGNGPRADAPVLGEVMGKEIGEAHNDYMSIRYNYGFLGLGLLLFGFFASFFTMYKMSLNNKDKIFQLLVLSNLTLFIGFMLFMYSDNILKYTVWFPNYFFVLMGICFSIYKKGFEYD
jgi:hypothetical protein